MKLKAVATTLSTTLVVAVAAAAWAITSPLAPGCAAAVPLEQIAAAPGDTNQFVAAINDLRRSQGLNDLSVDGNLTSIAQDWAVTMASQDGIFHRSDLRSGISILWQRLGENVGVGPNVSDLMQAFIASPGHYKNLVDPTFTHVGVGTVRTPDGLLYTAHEFAAVRGASATPPAPAPVTSPRVTTPRAPRVTTPPTTPPTTAAPVTTTTEPPVTVQRSVAQQDELQDRGAEDQQQQQDKNDGRCRAHTSQRLIAGGATAVSRPV